MMDAKGNSPPQGCIEKMRVWCDDGGAEFETMVSRNNFGSGMARFVGNFVMMWEQIWNTGRVQQSKNDSMCGTTQ